MIKVITHTDLDGIACAILIKELIGSEIDTSYCSYGDVNQAVIEAINTHHSYSKIFITDISVNEETAEQLNKIKEKVVLLDHHKTALYLNKYEWANVAVEEDGQKTCGASLVYKFLKKNDEYNHQLDLFVELVRRYDTWEWDTIYNDESAKKLNDIYYLKGREAFFNDTINSIKNDLPLFSAEDLIVLEYRQREIENYIEKKNKDIIHKDILGYKAGIIFADNYVSELGNRLIKMNPELDFIAMINQKSISYRTDKDNIDLSEVARFFGGGGHPKASGSRISEKQIDEFINILFYKKTFLTIFDKIKNVFKTK